MGAKSWVRSCGIALLAGLGLVAVGCGLLLGLAWLALHDLGSPGDVCERSDVPLQADARRGDVERVRWRLDRGDDPNARDRASNTALGCALPKGRTEVVRVLLERGADPNTSSGSVGSFDELPLELAMAKGDAQGERLLLEHGADPNRYTARAHGLPLAEAVGRGDGELVRLLLGHGADPNGEPGRRPLVEAAKRSDGTLYELLVAHGARLDLEHGPGSRGTVRDHVLQDAGAAWAVEAALAAGADPDQSDLDVSVPQATALKTPLQRAALRRDPASVRVLLDRGANPDAGQVDLVTLWAVTPGIRSGAVRSLLAPRPAGTTPSATGTSAPTPSVTVVPSPTPGQTAPASAGLLWDVPPVAVALAEQDDESLQLLLDHGADPNRLALGAYSPLYLAALDCNPHAVGMLVAKGARVGAVVDPSLRPEAVACESVRPLLP